MAVELRCPDCRAKLRLPEAPEAGTEVECPKCGAAFPAPDDEDVPKKKKKPARDEDEDDEDEKPKKRSKDKEEKKPKSKDKPPSQPKTPKRRKSKKNETSKTLLFVVVGLGLLMLASVGGVLAWFFGRTPKSVEMMYYIPDDCHTASGMNLGHAQKYVEFYKPIAGAFGGSEFKAAADAIAKALGEADADALTEYVVFGESKNASATVIRTKTEIDGSGLSKIAGSQSKTQDGKTYYVVPGFKGGGSVRVFAPTNRLIVYCPNDTPDAAFKKMINGNADSKDKTFGIRMGPLGTRTARGTFWKIELYDGGHKPEPPPAAGKGGEDAKSQFEKIRHDALSSSKGYGMKASIGSREVRFEVDVWCSDSEKAASMDKKWKESPLGKGDDEDPPRWWKDKTQSLGNRKVAAQMLANVGCGTSGELFYAKSAVETLDLKDSVGSVAGLAVPGAGKGGQQGGDAPQQGGAPQAGPGNKPRRRVWAKR